MKFIANCKRFEIFPLGSMVRRRKFQWYALSAGITLHEREHMDDRESQKEFRT